MVAVVYAQIESLIVASNEIAHVSFMFVSECVCVCVRCVWVYGQSI